MRNMAMYDNSQKLWKNCFEYLWVYNFQQRKFFLSWKQGHWLYPEVLDILISSMRKCSALVPPNQANEDNWCWGRAVDYVWYYFQFPDYYRDVKRSEKRTVNTHKTMNLVEGRRVSGIFAKHRILHRVQLTCSMKTSNFKSITISLCICRTISRPPSGSSHFNFFETPVY
jgi:hypothetical protein